MTTLGSMSSELAFFAYVFLGNAFHRLLNGEPVGFEADLGVERGALEALYGKVKPLTPKDVLPGVAGLGEEERELLVRVGRWCVLRLGTEFETLMGVSREEAGAVLDAVSVGSAG